MREIIFNLNNKTEKKGFLIKEENDYYIVKLKNGYNVIVKKKDVIKISDDNNSKELDKISIKQNNFKENKDKKKTNLKKRILLLHTGGTIASKVDYSTGAVTARFSADEILSLFPELTDLAEINSIIISNIQSEMIRFYHWNKIIMALKDNYDNYDGFIITHGTDTLHYTSAALSFALKVKKPVVLVGSQRSSDRPSTDSVSNLLGAVSFIVKNPLPGVFVAMHESITNDDIIIMNGFNIRKLHTSRRDAFKPINQKPLLRIKYPSLELEKISDNNINFLDNSFNEEFNFFDEKIKVGLYYPHPNMFANELLSFKDFDGLVIALFGLGHLPIEETDEKNQENKRIKEAIISLQKKTIIVGAPQTIFGRLNLNVYSPGRRLKELGIIAHLTDMCPETAFAKLAFLLSKKEKNISEKDFIINNRSLY